MLTKKFDITYPFSNQNLEEVYLDLDKTLTDRIKSQVLHVVFTPKGQRLRNPDFGTDVIKYIFSPSDDMTLESLKNSLVEDIARYVKDVTFNDISFNKDEKDEHSMIVIIKYSLKKGNKLETTSVGVKINI